MLHKTRFLLIFIMVLAVGLATFLWAPLTRSVNAQTNPDVLIEPVAGTAIFTEAQGGNSFTLRIREIGGVVAPAPTVANSNPNFASPINQHAIAFKLPVGIRFSSVSGNANITGCTTSGAGVQTVICNYGAAGTSIPANDIETVQINVTVTRPSTPTGSFPIYITIPPNDSNPGNNSNSQGYQVNTVPDLTVATVFHNGSNTPFTVGTPGTITGRVQNVGLGDTNSQVTLDFVIPPANFTFGSSGTAGWTCNDVGASVPPLPAGEDIRCTTNNVIPKGTSVDVTINVNPTTAGTNLTATAHVSGGAEPLLYDDPGNTDNDPA